ncbi:MAG: cation:proton antiporter [Fibrobacterota bacterium]
MNIKHVSFLFLLCTGTLLANDSASHGAEGMSNFVIQLGVIIFISRFGGILFKKAHLPPVLGEMTGGILIGPYLIGGLSLPGFPDGIFPLYEQGPLPISPELYGLVTIASILLLFFAGLKTDLKLFLRYSFAGTIIGVSGVLLSFLAGSGITAWFFNTSMFASAPLLVGVMSTATSIGITVRILSEKRKIDTPEGVTIIAGAVIDDILGILLLAVVTGMAAMESSGIAAINWNSLALIGIKAITMLLVVTTIGILFSEKIAGFLKRNRSISVISILSLGMALILAGIFEKAGLAMIIGGYIMGLIFSNTDLNISIQKKLRSLEDFFVPIFFTSIGMFVDVSTFVSPNVVLLGSALTAGSIAAKVLGCGIPSLFFKFNTLGASRIGFGMVPRGEVTLIIASIGLSSNLLTAEVFSAAILMTFLATMLGQIVLERLFSIDRRGILDDTPIRDTVKIPFECYSSDLTDLVITNLTKGFKAEGFYVNFIETNETIYHFQKDKSLITLYASPLKLVLEAAKSDEYFVKSMLYEKLTDLRLLVGKIQHVVNPEDIKRDISKAKKSPVKFNISKILTPELIKLNLTATTKKDAIRELLEVLFQNTRIPRDADLFAAVWERETTVSTGMENGVALPHARIPSINRLITVMGLSQDGIEFNTMDGKPARIVILTLIPDNKAVPYVQYLGGLASSLNSEEKVQKLLQLDRKPDIISFFSK